MQEVKALEGRLGLRLTVRPLERNEMCRRFFAKGRKCVIRCGTEQWDAVIQGDDDPALVCGGGWFYVRSVLHEYQKWNFNAVHLKEMREIDTEVIPRKGGLGYWMTEKERDAHSKEARRWSIVFDEAEWPFNKFPYL